MPDAGLDDRMMARAIELAREAEQIGEVPIGAVVYDGQGRVLGEGFNRRETDDDPLAHAEVLAIRAAAKLLGDWRLEGCSLAVTLEPCPMCAGAIVNSRIDRVIYGASDPKAGAVRSLYELLADDRLNHHVGEIVAGVREDECAQLLRAFFRKLRAK
ncbi:MAG: tRNA adenosine(34) deaminase TadA [Planctomycetota bacterium]